MLAWLRSALLDNLSFKLFALLLAIILFRRVNQEDLVKVATVQVNLVYAFPKELLMTSDPVNSIKVTLQGPESKLGSIAKSTWKFTVRLTDATPGPMQTELYTQEIRSIFPSDIQVTRIKPSILDVRFKKRVQKKLPIKVDLVGTPPLGFRLLKPVNSYPRQIVAEGPEDVLGKLEEIKTEQINLTGQRLDRTLNVKLVSPGRFVRFLGAEKARVVLQFHVEQGRKKFEDIPVKMLNFLNPKLDYELLPDKVKVTLYGPISQLQPLKKGEIIAEVDGSKIASLAPGEHKTALRVRAKAPDIKWTKAPTAITVKTMWKDGQAPKKTKPKDDDDDDDKPKRRKRRKRRVRKRRPRKGRARKRRRRKRPLRRPSKKRKTGRLRRRRRKRLGMRRPRPRKRAHPKKRQAKAPRVSPKKPTERLAKRPKPSRLGRGHKHKRVARRRSRPEPRKLRKQPAGKRRAGALLRVLRKTLPTARMPEVKKLLRAKKKPLHTKKQPPRRPASRKEK